MRRICLTWTARGAPAMDGPVYDSALLAGGATVAFSSPESGWAVGPGGRVTKLGFVVTR